MNNNYKDSIKKKIMFVKDEDFYFITYNILILLHVLNCFEQKKRVFKDCRKLAFLVEFVSNNNLVDIVERYDLQSRKVNRIDHKILTNAYTNGLIRKNIIPRLLFTLEKYEIVYLSTSERDKSINISLNDEKLKNFFNKELFAYEFKNASKLQRTISKLSILKLDTLLGKLFTDKGVRTWDI